MKKYLSLVIIPLMLVVFVMGCSKDHQTVDDYNNLYTSTKQEYQVDENINRMFATETVGDAVRDKLYVQFDNETIKGIVNGNASIGNDPTKQNYLNLKRIYQRITDLLFVKIYNNGITFTTTQKEKLTTAQIDSMYYALQAFTNELANFDSAKATLENEARLFATDPIIDPTIYAFNKQYNTLMLRMFDFIRAYINLNIAYDVNTSAAETYLDYYYTMVFNYVEALFYKTVYTYQLGELCDISYINDNFSEIFVLADSVTSISKSDQLCIYNANNKPEDASQQQVLVENLDLVNKNFVQQFDFYKRCIGSFNVYAYKHDEVNEATLSYENYTRYNLVKNFEDVVLKSYYNTILSCLKTAN